MYIDFDDIQKMFLYEDSVDNVITNALKKQNDDDLNTDKLRILSTKDVPNKTNKFTTRPQGIVIQDTYNNFALPIRPNPRIDTSKFDLLEVYQRYREDYTDFKPVILPWHFCIEMVQDRYFILNTRPIDMKYPLTNFEINQKVDKTSWADDTIQFFDRQLFDISEAIHICIIGDSTLDVYPNKFYTLLGRVCMGPLFGRLKIIRGSTQNVFPLNIGYRFNLTILNKFARR